MTTPEAERVALLTDEARQDLTYIANSGRLYATKAAEMLVADNKRRAALLKEKSNGG
jgi:hypothetical protein